MNKKTRLETIVAVADKAPELLNAATKPKRNKYGAIPTEVDGIRFASKHEARRYTQLKAMELAGEIHNLEPHPRYIFEYNGIRITTYRPDFQYTDAAGNLVVEDTKSKPTLSEGYKIRKKLMKAYYDIDVQEVYA